MHYSPTFIQNKLKLLQEKSELKEGLAKIKRTKVSKVEFSRLIDALNLDCDIMLHTSMINIGRMEGGVKFIAEKILDKVDTCNHTLLISALPYRGSFKSYLNSHPVFDVRTAPIEMGAINEYLAKKSDAVRSIHPTHSVVAIGNQSNAYVAEHHLDNTPFGVHSPYYKLLRAKGKILLVGATLNNLTFVHVIEDMLGELHPVKQYASQKYIARCIDYNGNEMQVETVVHDPWKGIFRNLSLMHDALIQQGIMISVPLGEAELAVIDANAFALYYLNLLQNGKSIYGKHKVSNELYQEINILKEKLK